MEAAGTQLEVDLRAKLIWQRSLDQVTTLASAWHRLGGFARSDYSILPPVDVEPGDAVGRP